MWCRSRRVRTPNGWRFHNNPMSAPASTITAPRARSFFGGRASAEMDVRFGAPSVVAAKDQHVVNTGCAQLAEGEFLRAGGHGGMSRPAAIRRLVEIGL